MPENFIGSLLHDINMHVLKHRISISSILIIFDSSNNNISKQQNRRQQRIHPSRSEHLESSAEMHTLYSKGQNQCIYNLYTHLPHMTCTRRRNRLAFKKYNFSIKRCLTSEYVLLRSFRSNSLVVLSWAIYKYRIEQSIQT